MRVGCHSESLRLEDRVQVAYRFALRQTRIFSDGNRRFWELIQLRRQYSTWERGDPGVEPRHRTAARRFSVRVCAHRRASLDTAMAHQLHDIKGDAVPERKGVMLYTIAVVLLILWALGLVSGYTIGAFIHVLLVIAVVLFLVGLLNGRRMA